MMKLKLYPAIGLAVTITLLTAAWFFLQRFQIEISSAVPESDTVPVLKAAPTQPVANPPATVSQAEDPSSSPNPALATARQGVLRISNRSEHSLRVALLLKSPKAPSPKNPNPYEAPAHWDFAPGEGSQQGLIVSLPNRRIIVKKGDILVAFAQDGSQRYWGPYIINETPAPLWNDQKAEWELILED